MVRLPPVRVSDKVAEKAERPHRRASFRFFWKTSIFAIDKPAGVAVHGAAA